MTSVEAAAGDTIDLDSATVERALAELWQQAAASEQGPPMTRAHVMTLVVYSEDEETAALAEAVAEALPERHPSRGIVVRVNMAESAPLRASLSIQCLLNRAGERTVCSELVTVTAGADTRLLIPGAVMPLLVVDLPAVVWWTGRPRPADPVLRRFARDGADRIVLDSGQFRDPGAGLIALSRWRDDARRRAALGDLAWERLREWRHLVSQTMDPPDGRAALARLRTVEIVYLPDQGGLPEEALLLAGWLAASLRWQPLDSPAHGEVTFGRGTEGVRLRFIPAEEGSSVARLQSVALRSDDGSRYAVAVEDSGGIGVCRVETESGATRQRVVPLGDLDPVDLVVRSLGRLGHDPVYEAALAAAAEIVVLGVTA
jgi:glucose-6-phosphate dehydrogenase assembly protein OpcA